MKRTLFLGVLLCVLATRIDIVDGQKRCTGDKYVKTVKNGRPRCRACPECIGGGIGYNDSVVREEDEFGYRTCYPCQDCAPGFYRPLNAHYSYCYVCVLDCARTNRYESVSCGGDTEGHCGDCLPWYEPESSEANSMCFPKLAVAAPVVPVLVSQVDPVTTPKPDIKKAETEELCDQDAKSFAADSHVPVRHREKFEDNKIDLQVSFLFIVGAAAIGVVGLGIYWLHKKYCTHASSTSTLGRDVLSSNSPLISASTLGSNDSEMITFVDEKDEKKKFDDVIEVDGIVDEIESHGNEIVNQKNELVNQENSNSKTAKTEESPLEMDVSCFGSANSQCASDTSSMDTDPSTEDTGASPISAERGQMNTSVGPDNEEVTSQNDIETGPTLNQDAIREPSLVRGELPSQLSITEGSGSVLPLLLSITYPGAQPMQTQIPFTITRPRTLSEQEENTTPKRAVKSFTFYYYNRQICENDETMVIAANNIYGDERYDFFITYLKLSEAKVRAFEDECKLHKTPIQDCIMECLKYWVRKYHKEADLKLLLESMNKVGYHEGAAEIVKLKENQPPPNYPESDPNLMRIELIMKAL